MNMFYLRLLLYNLNKLQGSCRSVRRGSRGTWEVPEDGSAIYFGMYQELASNTNSGIVLKHTFL